MRFRRNSTTTVARSRSTFVVQFHEIHKARKLTPAITDRLWTVEDIVALVEAAEPKPWQAWTYKSGRPHDRTRDEIGSAIAGDRIHAG
jgi:hypothetical protein